jgi:hypothetical protein
LIWSPESRELAAGTRDIGLCLRLPDATFSRFTSSSNSHLLNCPRLCGTLRQIDPKIYQCKHFNVCISAHHLLLCPYRSCAHGSACTVTPTHQNSMHRHPSAHPSALQLCRMALPEGCSSTPAPPSPAPPLVPPPLSINQLLVLYPTNDCWSIPYAGPTGSRPSWVVVSMTTMEALNSAETTEAESFSDAPPPPPP